MSIKRIIIDQEKFKMILTDTLSSVLERKSRGEEGYAEGVFVGEYRGVGISLYVEIPSDDSEPGEHEPSDMNFCIAVMEA